MLLEYVKNNINYYIISIINVEKLYKEQHLLLNSFNNKCWKVYKEQHLLLFLLTINVGKYIRNNFNCWIVSTINVEKVMNNIYC